LCRNTRINNAVENKSEFKAWLKNRGRASVVSNNYASAVNKILHAVPDLNPEKIGAYAKSKGDSEALILAAWRSYSEFCGESGVEIAVPPKRKPGRPKQNHAIDPATLPPPVLSLLADLYAVGAPLDPYLSLRWVDYDADVSARWAKTSPHCCAFVAQPPHPALVVDIQRLAPLIALNPAQSLEAPLFPIGAGSPIAISQRTLFATWPELFPPRRAKS
jgi:hypothetical protein